MSEEIKDQVIIEEPEVKEAEEVTIEVVDSLPAKEKEMVEKHGLIKKEVKDATKTEDELKANDGSAGTKEGVKKEGQSFEDTEKDEKNLLGNYTANEKALYWKWKHDKKERQEAQSRANHEIVKSKAVEKKLNEVLSNHDLTMGKLTKIQELLSGPQDQITIEALQGIIQEVHKKDAERPVTKKDLEEIEAQKQATLQEQNEKQARFNERVVDANAYIQENFENHKDIFDAAQDVISGKIELPSVIDPNELAVKLNKLVQDEDTEIETIANFVRDLAKLNPNFGKKEAPKGGNGEHKESQEKIDRMLKNASKPQTSAAVTSGASRRVVNYDDLTLEDAARLTPEQWSRLPKPVVQRLLSE